MTTEHTYKPGEIVTLSEQEQKKAIRLPENMNLTWIKELMSKASPGPWTLEIEDNNSGMGRDTIGYFNTSTYIVKSKENDVCSNEEYYPQTVLPEDCRFISHLPEIAQLCLEQDAQPRLQQAVCFTVRNKR